MARTITGRDLGLRCTTKLKEPIVRASNRLEEVRHCVWTHSVVLDAGSGVGAGVLLQASITRPLPLQALVALGRGEGDWQRVSVGHRLSGGLGDGGGGPSLYCGTVLPAENKCQKRIISKVTKVFRQKDIF